MSSSKVECPFCGFTPEGKGGFVWCVNPKCWIKNKKIPKKVWNDRVEVDHNEPIQLGHCNTCIHQNCFSRVNTGGGYATLDFCSEYDPDSSLSLSNPVTESLKESFTEDYTQVVFSRKLIDRMPLGWLVLFTKLLQFHERFKKDNDGGTEFPNVLIS